MARQFYTSLDLNLNQILDAVLHKTSITSVGGSAVAGQIIYDTTDSKAKIFNGVSWDNFGGNGGFINFTDGTNTAVTDSASDTFKFRSANGILTLQVTNDDATHGDNILFTINQGSIDHGTIGGLTDDDHSQYVHISNARTVSVGHTFSATQAFTHASAPFTVTGTNKVTNLNADMVDGFHASATPTANYVVVADGSNKIAAGWISEVIATSDLSDIDSKTGTGTTLVMSGSPSINKPTLVASSGISLDAGAGRLTNLGTPTSSTDAVTKNYVDTLIQGFTQKITQCATTANVSNFSGGAPAVVDGVTVQANYRIFVNHQNTNSQNGIYVVQSVGSGSNGTWIRATDADSSTELSAGLYVYVDSGTIYGNTGWVLQDTVTTVGSSSVQFMQFSGLGTVVVSNEGGGVPLYISSNGNQLNFRSLTSDGSSIDIVDNGDVINFDLIPSNIDINNFASTLAVSKGGTGGTTAAQARTSLSFVTAKNYTITGNSPWTLNHQLNTVVVTVQAYTSTLPYEQVEVGVEVVDANNVRISTDFALGSTVLRIVIMG